MTSLLAADASNNRRQQHYAWLAGPVIGGIAALAVVAGTAWLVVRRRRSSSVVPVRVMPKEQGPIAPKEQGPITPKEQGLVAPKEQDGCVCVGAQGVQRVDVKEEPLEGHEQPFFTAHCHKDHKEPPPDEPHDSTSLDKVCMLEVFAVIIAILSMCSWQSKSSSNPDFQVTD